MGSNTFTDWLQQLFEGFAGDPPGMDTDKESYEEAVEQMWGIVAAVKRVPSENALLVTLTEGTVLRVSVEVTEPA